LTSTLLEHGLAYVIMLFVYPVLPGSGKRFFSNDTASRRLVLAASSGVLINTYTLAGPLRSGSSDDAGV
jgi:dihydrofolate reductase